MELLSPSKKIWDKWACTYGPSGNIILIFDTFEKSFKSKGSKQTVEDVYASLYGFFTQLEAYQLPTSDMAMQLHYREELAISLFLNSI